MVRVNVLGVKELQAVLRKEARELSSEVDTEVKFAGERFVELAVKDLRSKLNPDSEKSGRLLGSIQSFSTRPLAVEVVASQKYAPFLEWGTITKANVPAELADYAIQFKGKGIRKTGGIYPRPFFFKQLPIVANELRERISEII